MERKEQPGRKASLELKALPDLPEQRALSVQPVRLEPMALMALLVLTALLAPPEPRAPQVHKGQLEPLARKVRRA